MTWRDIPGFPGYKVNEVGQVSSARGVLSPWVSAGYATVGLRRDGRTYRMAVHRLVLMAFIGPAPAKADGCHSNGDRLDNRVENLRWASRSENIRDQVKHGRHNNASKTECPQGHAYTDENTYVLAGGRRQCVSCTKSFAAASYARKKAMA